MQEYDVPLTPANGPVNSSSADIDDDPFAGVVEDAPVVPADDPLASMFEQVNDQPDTGSGSNKVPALMSTQEKIDFNKWMSGSASEPPAAVREMTVNFAQRAGWGLSFEVVRLFQGMNELSEFTQAAERKIFDPKNLDNFPAYGEEVQDLYKLAVTSREKYMEFIRKFIVQNRDILDMTVQQDPNPEVTQIVKILSDLPAEKLTAFLKELEGATD